MDGTILQQLESSLNYFRSGTTKDYSFRYSQLLQLKNSVLKYQDEIHQALYKDLKKTAEESWVTETGFLIAEINHTLKHLKQWMKPTRVSTNLLNLPAKSLIYKEPLGVVLIIGPWNYPIQLLLTPLVGAIAAGNCVILKPSEFAPATAKIIRKIIEECFAAEFVFLVEGDGSTVIPGMMKTFRFDHVFYTGSTQVGKLIYEMAATRLTPVTLELGGKSPCVVEEDANIKIAARRIALTKFSNVGQMCVAPDYLLVHEAVKDQLVQELISNLRKFYTDDASASAEYGKIINEKQFYRLQYYLQQGKIIYGGRHDLSSLYIEPTLMENVPLHMSVMGEEIFGPILPILSFKTFEEAKEIINHNPNPLAFYVFTGSTNKEKRWIEEIPFGGGCVNNASWHLTNYNLPFGGRGNSGIGKYHGKFSFDTFSHFKSIMKTPTWFDPAIKYPPFAGKLNLFKKIIR